MVVRLIRICRIQWCCSLFLFLRGNTLFGQIWSKKSKLSLWAEIWYLKQFEHAEFNGDVHFFCFWSEISFWDKFGRKSQNYHFKLKFVTYTNSNMKNSMMLFSFFSFWVQIPFLGKFGPKSQNSHFKLEFSTYTNSNMQNSMVMFIYFVFDWKYPFWANLSKRSKLSVEAKILLPGLIRIYRIQWCCSRFLFLSGNTVFG